MDLLTALSKVEDSRRGQSQRIRLDQILIMSILSYLCGPVGYRGISRLFKAYSTSLCTLLCLKHPVPSHVTFFNVLSRVDHKQVIAAFNRWACSITDLKSYIWVSRWQSPWFNSLGYAW